MRHLLYIVIMLAITGCSCSNSHVTHRLDRTEAMMHTDPAAAMEQLNGYDVAEFRDSAVMARWALLYSEALVANRIKAPADTIVDIAIDYYDRHHSTERLHHALRLKSLLQTSGDTDALASALYLQKEKEFVLYKERASHRQFILFSIIIAVTAAGIITGMWQRLKIKKMQTAALMTEASVLRDGLMSRQSVCSELQSKLESVMSTRFKEIDRLCETYYESQGTRLERNAIANKMKSLIGELKSDAGLFSDMVRCVNDCNSGMLDSLCREWPEIKPDDYRLMVYLACNLSNRTIALLIGESIDVVYKRKSRLKAKIADRSLPQARLYMSIF